MMVLVGSILGGGGGGGGGGCDDDDDKQSGPQHRDGHDEISRCSMSPRRCSMSPPLASGCSQILP